MEAYNFKYQKYRLYKN